MGHQQMALWAFSDVLWRLPLGRWKGRRVPLIPLSIALIFAEVFLFALISIVLDADHDESSFW